MSSNPFFNPNGKILQTKSHFCALCRMGWGFICVIAPLLFPLVMDKNESYYNNFMRVGLFATLFFIIPGIILLGHGYINKNKNLDFR